MPHPIDQPRPLCGQNKRRAPAQLQYRLFFTRRCEEHVPSVLWPALEPVFRTIAKVSEQIHELDSKIMQLCRQQYPETERLQQVSGVGPVTALAYVLTIEDPQRFSKSRQVGPFLGLTPRRGQSGKTDQQLHISKAGNNYLRKLLVGSAHYILEPFGPDCSLRRYGLAITARGGKNAKKTGRSGCGPQAGCVAASFMGQRKTL